MTPMRWLAVVVGVLLAAEIIVSFTSPHVMPRLGALPRPSTQSWYDGCNWHTRSYHHWGPVWAWDESHTDRACFNGPEPPP